MTNDLKILNKQQKEAVIHGDGPMLIIAGAGTGKTTVIIERIKYLISSKKAKPSEVLALTFTQKAAEQMQERVDIAMPLGYTQMWISTFHAFCDQLLRESAHHIGLDLNYRLLAQSGSIHLLRTRIFDFDLKYFRPLGNPTKFVYALSSHFSRLQDEDITSSEYLKWASKQKGETKEEKLEAEKWLELANAYKKYDEIKIKEGYLDFGDLITKTLDLFKKRPNVLKGYQKCFKYILIDEFQDTNFAQNKLAITLAGKKANITVVADDDQSIYRFRGAAVSNVLEFRKIYPRSKLVSLTTNYRSYQEILDASYKLVQFNNPDRLEVVEKIDKKLKANRKTGGEIVFLHENKSEHESDRVGNEIKKLVEKDDYQYGDIAILVRANNHAEAFMASLERLQIPYLFLGPEKLLLRPEIVDLISYLKVIYDFEDSVFLSRVLSIDSFGISGAEIVKFGNVMRKTNKSLYEVIGESESEMIQTLVKMIDKHIDEQKRKSAGEILYEFLTVSGILDDLYNADTLEAQTKAQNISEFFEKIKSFESTNKSASITQVVDWLNLLSEIGDSPLAGEVDWSESDTVKIFTVHSAKGLEFPVVFLVNLVSERFPSRRRNEPLPLPDNLIKESLPEGDFHLQEERRLFYVGMTRARDKLYLSASDFYGDGIRKKKLSPFIFEALGEDVASTEKEDKKQLSLLDFKKQNTKPKKLITSQFHLDYLSYSQIQTFKICPLHYKLKYILKIPTPPTSAQSFGISMHETMKRVYQKAIESKKKITPKTAEKILDQEWINLGYENKKHESQAFEKAQEYLKMYLKNQFDSDNLPILLEKPFVVNLQKGGERLKIGGKIDRVDSLGKNKIEIVDYKTGENIPDQKAVDKDMQLSFYALAATRIDEKPLGVKPENISLSLYYFDEDKKFTTKRTQADLKTLTDEVFEIKKQIEESDFKCSKHPFCESCEYSLYCKAIE